MSSDFQNEDFQIVNKLSKYISNNSQEKIISILKRTKADSKYEKQFIKEENLNLLIDLLQFRNLEIINLTLSLLADMCKVLEIREKVRAPKIAIYTLWIIRNLEGSYNLHCRAVRLIGNLSECSWHAKSFCDQKAVGVLTDILHSKTYTEVHIMTVRAIRNIWNSYKKSRIEILQSGAISKIVTLFVRASKKSESKYVGLKKACLKAMCSFAESLDFECAIQMRGDIDEEGFKCIMEICEEKNDLALKCLFNLSLIAKCRPILGSCGVIERLLLLITNNEKLSWQILAILCHFCREAVNRVQIKSVAGLEIMMALLKNKENEKFHSMILDALVLFEYDEDGIAIMVKNGLLDVLIEKLKLMITAEELQFKNEKGTPKKRSGDSSPYERSDFKYNRTSLGRFSLDYHYDNWSPSSGASTSSSPPSTPPLPLYDCKDFDESAEENYSPVCSDDEWTEKEHSLNFSEKVKSSASKHVKKSTLTLLSILSDSNEPMEKLADPLVITSLSTYIKLTKDPKALQILTKIAKNSAYLVPLIQQGFVFEAQTIYGCKQCLQQLSALAETGGAVGQLSSILLCGTETNKNMTAISIPFLIKAKKNLKYLLSKHSGILLIFRILENPKHILHDNAILSISQLAKLLDIQPHAIDWSELLMETNIEPLDREKCDNLSNSSLVTFILDDGTTVDACRETLCQKSECFAAMLNGKFLEAGKKTMLLKDTSKESLNILLLAANGDTFQNETIEELLDAVLLANKYLMPDVLEILIKISISRLNYNNFSRVWNWTRHHSPHFHVWTHLKTFCLESFLTSRMTRSERLQAFRNFSACKDFKIFLVEVKEMLISSLYLP
ncbi:armadillo repeat-containing protein 5 [Leptopilina boulardi]|uniref:armadillo repeat-containing protein 5 n=1 Tax=Leptopilina boulardi TaxID=63433 RepID=UPI0021F5E8B9|nr:armadillo repeat-containing protein 5 [Leptopilina boulardi]